MVPSAIWDPTQTCLTEDACTVLRDTRLIYVAPAAGRSGVGDYAADFAAAIKPHFKELTALWVDSPGETARDVIRNVRRIRALAHEQSRDGPTIAHFEQGGASLTPFYGAMLARDVPVTATLHDPPHPVWWPYATRTVLRHRLFKHALHFPSQSPTRALERRMSKGTTLIALTSLGAAHTRCHQPGARVVTSRIFIPPRPPIAPLTERPLAVGMFGYVYRAKGFDKIRQLREQVDDDIEIVVAGRGTETLPAVPGVTTRGEVMGSAEDRFFEGIRLLLVPYRAKNLYGHVRYSASAAVSRAFAYGTPIICNLEGALTEIAAEGGALGINGDVAEIAQGVNTVARDVSTLQRLADEIAQLQTERTVLNCATPFLHAWAEIAAGSNR
jgi:glycosyltransferase involved in cell wall biosynthesis